MKKIGIFLTLNPWENLKNDEHSRRLKLLIQHILMDSDTKIVIATAGWYEENLKAFFAQEKLDAKEIEFLSTKKTPYILQTLRIQPGEPGKRPIYFLKKIGRFYNRIRLGFNGKIVAFLAYWLRKQNIYSFLTIKALLMLAGISLLPIFAFLALGKNICHHTKKYYHRLQFKLPRRIKALPSKIKFIFSTRSSILKNEFFIKKIFFRIRLLELKRLSVLINKRDDIDVWYAPSLRSEEVALIKVKKIVTTIDLVAFNSPTEKIARAANQLDDENHSLFPHVNHIICHHPHIKETYLYSAFQQHAAAISVIAHGFYDLNKHLLTPPGAPMLSKRHMALQILKNYQSDYFHHNRYLADYNFADVQFMVYTAAHKNYRNFLNLVKAYEIALRKRYLSVKLILTIDFAAEPELQHYILANRLQHDIISFADASDQVLAALNYLAVLAIHPSFFESEFPCTFADAYALGTPSIMSKIPVISANMNDTALASDMLFSPHDIIAIADKIEYALQHTAELYTREAPLFAAIKQRSWQSVAAEYMHVFKEVART